MEESADGKSMKFCGGSMSWVLRGQYLDENKRNVKDWEEEVSCKSTLKWYNLPKNGGGMTRCVRSVQGQKVVRLLFRWTVTAGLLVDKKRCKMTDERYMIMLQGNM